MSAERGKEKQLTNAFAASHARWGGRFSLCVPVETGKISQAYLSWLSEFDPDVVEVLCPIDADTLAKVDKVTTAFRISQVPKRIGDVGPELSSSFLSSFTTLPQFIQQPLLPMWQGQKRRLLDGIPEFEDDFVLDNFGTPVASFGRNLPPYLSEFAHSIFLTRAPRLIDEFSDAPSDFLVADEVQFLRQLGAGPEIVTLSQLASHRGFQMTWPNAKWTDNFTLVVGDSVVDRVCYWNARLLAGSWSYEAATSIRVPPARLVDREFCQALASVLRNRVALGLPFDATPKVSVRSHSVPLAELQSLCEDLAKELRAEFVYAEIADTRDVAPTGPRNDHVSYFQERESTEVAHLASGSAMVTMPMPRHIAANGEYMHGQDGDWLVDCRIGRSENFSRYDNVTHDWLLPRRPQPARLFFPDDEARVDSTRQLTVRTSTDERVKKLSVPDDAKLFRNMFLSDDSFYRYRDDARYGTSEHPSPYEMRTGDKGQVLNGTIGLFGGFVGALSFIGLRFWRDYFLSLAAPNRDPERLKSVAARLKERIGGSGRSVTLASDEDWERLAKTTIEISGNIRVPRSITTVASVAQAWSVGSAKTAAVQPELIASISEHERQRLLEESLRALRDLGVFAQGRKWRCVECGYQNWTNVQNLSERLECGVCKQPGDLPLSFEWDFRLNDFLASSLREHDTLSLFSALTHLWLRAARSFYFCPPTEFMMKNLADWRRFVPDFEVDLVCVVDGKLVMVECKESGRITDNDLDKLVAAATALRPEKIVLATLQSNARLEARAKQLRDRVHSLGVEVETIQGMPVEWTESSVSLQ